MVDGQIQGVGFRPWVVRRARSLGLTGWVRNAPGGVEIEVQGSRPERLLEEPPTRVRLRSEESLPPVEEQAFTLRPSTVTGSARALIPPDRATCPACWEEWAGTGRRGGYALISCTDCGPRASVLQDLPLDREHTAMVAFPLCAACQEEHEDPEDRRFHAQVTACPACGPRVSGLDEALRVLEAGGIVALKGLSGFQLLARPDQAQRLRELKGRPDKPLAVLVDDPVTPECPIRLGPMLPGLEHLTDGLPWLGRMGPATPLHRVLLREGPLICTSGNRTGEALARTREQLPPVDAVIDHDRPILQEADDSVVRGPLLLRRGRGTTWPVPVASGPTVLGMGAHQKATLCLAVDDQAVLTPYLGTLSHRSVLERYERELQRLLRLYGRPEAVACDLHPDYVSTLRAEELVDELGVPLLRVQHHEAHVAAVLAEYGHHGPAIGVAWDGTGLGHDGLVRGSEVLRWDGGFTRLAALASFPLAGRAERSPRVCAEGLLDPEPWGRPSSSMGRLFDAAAFLCGIEHDTSYEAAAAMHLEALVGEAEGHYPLPLRDGLWDASVLVRALRDDPAPPGVRATRFHRSLVRALVEVCEGTEAVVLSGGCFQNLWLLEHAVAALEAQGHRVLFPRQVPPNDEAVALGQAWLARERL